jgi:hypothetical protein
VHGVTAIDQRGDENEPPKHRNSVEFARAAQQERLATRVMRRPCIERRHERRTKDYAGEQGRMHPHDN